MAGRGPGHPRLSATSSGCPTPRLQSTTRAGRIRREGAGGDRVRRAVALLEIQGYADARGGDEYNLRLSERRAQRVLAWLVLHGVSSDRLTIAGQGEASPVETDSAEASQEQNRRVVFRVLRLQEGP